MANRKLDLLAECNDQHVAPNEFKATFCRMCRNPTCVNAQWAGSQWEHRVSTQVERLLTDPSFVDPTDHRFDHIRALNFVGVQAPLVLNSADPWQGPKTVGVTPTVKSASTLAVDAAMAALGRGAVAPPSVPSPISIVTPTLPRVEIETPTLPRIEVKAPRKPAYEPPSTPPPIPAPAVKSPPAAPVDLGGMAMNTEFPEVGVMVDGTPVENVPRPAPPVDPWNPASGRVVPAGARIKMGG